MPWQVWQPLSAAASYNSYDCCSCSSHRHSCCCCRLTACLGKFTAYSILVFPPLNPLALCPANRLIEFHECVECEPDECLQLPAPAPADHTSPPRRLQLRHCSGSYHRNLCSAMITNRAMQGRTVALLWHSNNLAAIWDYRYK